MNISKLKTAMDNLKKNAGDALVVSSIIGYKDGQTLLHYNSDPKTDALIAKMSEYCVQVFAKAGFPPVEDYYMIDLENDMVAVVLLFDDYCWVISVDKHKLQIGMLLNVLLPDTIAEFKACL